MDADVVNIGRKASDFIGANLPDIEKAPNEMTGFVRGARYNWPVVVPPSFKEKGAQQQQQEVSGVPAMSWVLSPKYREAVTREIVHKMTHDAPLDTAYGGVGAAVGGLATGVPAGLLALLAYKRHKLRNALLWGGGVGLAGALAGGIGGKLLGDYAKNDIERRVIADKGYPIDGDSEKA